MREPPPGLEVQWTHHGVVVSVPRYPRQDLGRFLREDPLAPAKRWGSILWWPIEAMDFGCSAVVVLGALGLMGAGITLSPVGLMLLAAFLIGMTGLGLGGFAVAFFVGMVRGASGTALELIRRTIRTRLEVDATSVCHQVTVLGRPVRTWRWGLAEIERCRLKDDSLRLLDRQGRAMGVIALDTLTEAQRGWLRASIDDAVPEQQPPPDAPVPEALGTLRGKVRASQRTGPS